MTRRPEPMGLQITPPSAFRRRLRTAVMVVAVLTLCALAVGVPTAAMVAWHWGHR